jgi:hypothetical protein
MRTSLQTKPQANHTPPAETGGLSDRLGNLTIHLQPREPDQDVNCFVRSLAMHACDHTLSGGLGGRRHAKHSWMLSPYRLITYQAVT